MSIRIFCSSCICASFILATHPNRQFFNYASNASINGVCTVDKTLAELLKKVAFACGLEVENEKQWLQMCCYYDVYGGIEQLADPIRGLGAHSAFIAEMGKENVVTYDRIKYLFYNSLIFLITRHISIGAMDYYTFI